MFYFFLIIIKMDNSLLGVLWQGYKLYILNELGKQSMMLSRRRRFSCCYHNSGRSVAFRALGNIYLSVHTRWTPDLRQPAKDRGLVQLFLLLRTRMLKCRRCHNEKIDVGKHTIVYERKEGTHGFQGHSENIRRCTGGIRNTYIRICLYL